MDREALVYVDLDGVPHLMGRLWARTRKNKESASFEHDKDMDGKSRAILWSRLCRLLPACFTRRQTRPCSAAVGDSTPDRWGVRSCPAWNAGARSGERGHAAHAQGNRLPAAGGRRGPWGCTALCGK